jgi:putative transposase
MILICKIYEDNKHCYGYRQIALAINELVVKVNHKKIKHLMYKMKLFGIRIKDW